MMRLIDADALMEHLFNEIQTDEPLVCAMETHVKYKIDNAPTIDAVPVEQCKNCVKRGSSLYYDGFCSDGERKDNG